MDRSKITLRFFALLLGGPLLGAPLEALCSEGKSNPPAFKFHLKKEPGLDATQGSPGEAAYAFSNLYRGLTRYAGESQVVFEQAEKCRLKTDTLLSCQLRKNVKWSDGEPVTASDFVNGFRRLLAPGSHCPVLELLWGIKNARPFYEGKAKPEQLGVKAVSKTELQFELEEKDQEFLDKLSHPLFAPYRQPKDINDKTTFFYNGPYQVKSWEKNKRIVLTPNPYYPTNKPEKLSQRPNVEIVFAMEDSAGRNLYEKGVINFLWRLNDVDIPSYKNRPDFHQVTQARYDYLGFNTRLGSPFKDKELRKVFAQATSYVDFVKVFSMLLPGSAWCPGLGEPFMNPDGHCVVYDSTPKHLKLDKPIRLMFSTLGGDDIRHFMEWFQEQWRQKLDVKVDLQGMEQGHYRALLKETPPDSFRVGVMLTRPTCLAALEKFKKGNSENYTGFDNKKFNELTEILTHQKLSRAEQASICEAATDILFKTEFVGIPMGKIQFTLLADPHFQGWTLNELNQLDLSELIYVDKK